MGGQREYIPSRGFTEYLYHQIGDTLTANGVSGKVIARQSSDNLHDGLPKYSNTSKVYFKLDDVTKMIEQARVYENRRVAYDFDWGHSGNYFHESKIRLCKTGEPAVAKTPNKGQTPRTPHDARSARTMAATASTMTGVRRTKQTSWRPGTLRAVCSPVSTFRVV